MITRTLMSETVTTPSDRQRHVAEAANRWALQLADGPLPAGDLDEFVAWVDEDPAHETALRQAREALNQVSLAAGHSEYEEWRKPSVYERVAGWFYEARQRVEGLRGGILFSGRARMAAALAAAASVAVVIVAATPMLEDLTGGSTGTPEHVEPDLVTAIGEIREETLDDGSIVTLGAASAVDVDFTRHERRVTLTAGEAFFEVGRDPDRPFLVVAGATIVRVIGTEFDVSLGEANVDIAVADGRVEVIRARNAQGLIKDSDVQHVLTAGQRVSARAGGRVAPVEVLPVEDVAAWRRGELVWIDTRAEEIVADLNRYSATPIRLDARRMGPAAYTLAVTTQDIEAAIELLATSMGLERVNDERGILLQ